MAQECGFFNAQLVGEDEYDRVYLAEQFAAYFASFIGNGIFGNSMQQLEVVSQNVPNMSVKVLPGQAWINGWWYRNSEEYTLPIDVADGVLYRIDTIVLRWGNQERDMWLHVIKGTPSSSPIAPSIVRDADYYDLELATVSVDRGAIRITQANITDMRMNAAVCGLVTGVVDQVDLTDLWNQFEQYFREFKERYNADFLQWSEDRKAEFLAFVAQERQAYQDYIKDTQQDYDDWTAEKKTEWAQWVTRQEADFEAWVEAETTAYENWTAAQQQVYQNWYTLHTSDWEREITEWFEGIKGQLSGDIAVRLQMEVDDLKAKQPTELVAEIEHNRDVYLTCDMFTTEYACGVQGAGIGPAGGDSLVSSEVEYEMPDRNNIKIKAVPGLGTVEQVTRLSEDMYGILFENKIKSLVVMLHGKKEVSSVEQ